MCFFAPLGATLAGYGTVGAATAAGASTAGLGLLGAGAIASVASPLVAYAGQRQMAKQQAAYQAQAAAAERQRFMQERTAFNIQEAQRKKAAGEEMFDIAVGTMKAADTVAMRTQGRGATGLSAEALINDVYSQAADVQFRITQQQEMGETAAILGMEQAEFLTEQRQIAIGKPINRGSLALAGLQAASGGLTATLAGRQYGASFRT